jgi:hypothetical protein
MPKYDAENFDPPAPVAYVSIRDPATGVSLSDVPMLLDTGADVTMLPGSYVEQLGTEPVLDIAYVRTDSASLIRANIEKTAIEG